MQGSTAVILLNFRAKNPPHRQAVNRYRQCLSIIMKVYHRNTNFSFLLLWTVSILLIVSVTVCMLTDRFLLALLISGLVIIAGTFKIHGLTIDQKGISIRRYNAFGFQKKELTIPKKELNNVEFWAHGNLDDSSSTDSWLDFFLIPALFVAGKKGMTIKIATEQKLNSYKLYLTDKEYHLLKELTE